MSYIVSIGALTFKFDDDEYAEAIHFAEVAARTNEDNAVVTIRLVLPAKVD